MPLQLALTVFRGGYVIGSIWHLQFPEEKIPLDTIVIRLRALCIVKLNNVYRDL